jgi:hypothetical protein
MPIQLPAISRKEFLKRALVLGAGLAFAPGMFAATKRKDANSWALLADTHVAADLNQVVRGMNMSANLRSIVNEALGLPKRPAGAFVVGDCAWTKGEAGDYETLAGLIEPLRGGGMPARLALGNHDHRDNFWQALESERTLKRPVVEHHVALIESPRVNWFMMDSLEATLQTPGKLGEEQLAWLERTLDKHSRKPAVLLIHHNPGAKENIAGLKDTERLFEIIRPRRQVKAWFFGHTHHWSMTQDESGIHLVNLPPAAYPFKEGDPAGWVHATIDSHGMKLELRSLDTTHKEHGRETELRWRKS